MCNKVLTLQYRRTIFNQWLIANYFCTTEMFGCELEEPPYYLYTFQLLHFSHQDFNLIGLF